jgi:transposase
MHRHELSDREWLKIEPLLPSAWGRRSIRGDRNFVNAVIWIAKTGAPWRDLNERFGRWKTIYNRFNNWSKRGIWKKIFEAIQIDIDPDGSMADASIIRAHQHSAGGKGGPNKTLLVNPVEVFQQKFTRL